MIPIQQSQIDDLKPKIAAIDKRISHLQESRARASAMADGCQREPDIEEWRRKAREFAALASTLHEEKIGLQAELAALQSLSVDAVNPAALTETRAEISRIESALVQNKAAIAAQLDALKWLEAEQNEAGDEVACAKMVMEDLLTDNDSTPARIESAEKNLARAQAECTKKQTIITEKIGRSCGLVSGLERRRRGFEAELKAANLKARLIEQTIAETDKASGLERLQKAYDAAISAYRELLNMGHYHPATALFQRHMGECQSVKF